MQTVDGHKLKVNNFYYSAKKVDGIYISKGFILKKDMGINTSSTFKELTNCIAHCAVLNTPK